MSEKLAEEDSKDCCFVCKKEEDLVRCAGCKYIFYCGRDCQKKDWKAHKADCKKMQKLRQDKNDPDEDPYRHKEHKAAFDKVIKKYGLDKGTKADDIADYLTSHDAGEVTSKDFAKKFGTSVDDAMIFLSWIDVGIKFKAEVLDNAKKTGLDKMGL